MITHGPEFDNFKVEPGMELESFDMKQAEEIFLNHPFKILMYFLVKHPPGCSRWDGIDLSDFYFEMLDDYNRYGISFRREDNLFPDNCLYVVENDNSKKEKCELHFKSKYVLLFNNNYDKKTLLFNKVKKINLNDYDKGENHLSKLDDCIKKILSELDVYFDIPIFSNMKKIISELNNLKRKLSEWDYEKRKIIKEQKNEYLKVALMDPNVYNNENFFEDIRFGILDDYNAELEIYPSLMFTDKKYDDYIKREFKIIIDMVRNIHYLINEGNSEYLGIIED